MGTSAQALQMRNESAACTATKQPGLAGRAATKGLLHICPRTAVLFKHYRCMLRLNFNLKRAATNLRQAAARCSGASAWSSSATTPIAALSHTETMQQTCSNKELAQTKNRLLNHTPNAGTCNNVAVVQNSQYVVGLNTSLFTKAMGIFAICNCATSP